MKANWSAYSVTATSVCVRRIPAIAAVVVAFSCLGATDRARGQGGGPDALLARLEPTGLVNDYAGLLSREDRDALQARLSAVEAARGAQIAVVTLNSLEGGDIDDFAVKLFERWKIGQAGKDNGVLVLVAVRDRKARIEVGYGLEGVLPDSLAGRILDEQLLSAFRRGRYSEGLRAGVSRVAEIVERNEPAPVAQPFARRGSVAEKWIIGLFCLPFVMIGGFLVGFAIGLPARPDLIASKFGSGFVGMMFGGVMLAVAYHQTGPVGAAILAMLGLNMMRAGVAAGRNSVNSFRGTRRRRPSGWSTGWMGPSAGWGGGFGGGSSSSWGGFGGGSSGGGGASGGW